MKKSLVLIGLVAGTLMMSGCGDKKDNKTYANWKECEAETLIITSDLVAGKITQDEAGTREKQLKEDCKEFEPKNVFKSEPFNTNKPTQNMNANTMMK